MSWWYIESSILDSSLLGSAKTEILFESTLHPQLTRGQRGPGGTRPAAANAQPFAAAAKSQLRRPQRRQEVQDQDQEMQ